MAPPPSSSSSSVSAQRWARHPDVSAEEVGGELVLAQLAHGSTFRLNGSGRAIYQLVIAGSTAVEIGAALAGQLGAPAERIAADAARLIGELVAARLLAPAAPPPASVPAR
ncbi:MAG: PqqD family protein [Deltaproteobacteria bacterium]|nr:PqqD family protein [Deltaproteobacteria bacterium]